MATKGEEGSSEAALGLEGRQMSSAQSPREKSLEPANPEVKAQEPIGQNPKPNQSIDDDKTSFKEPPKSNSPGVDLLAGPEEAHVENSEQELIEHEALTHVDRGDPTDVKSAEEKDIKSDKLSEETEHVSVQEKTPALHIPESLEQEKLAEDLDESLQTTNRNTQETPSKEQEEEKGEIAQSLDPRGLGGPPPLNIPSADLSQVGPESAHEEVDPQFQGETESVDPKTEKIEEQHEEHSVINEERPKDAAIAKNEGSEAENLTQQQKEVNYVDCEKSTSIKADEQREAHKLAGEEEPREDNGTKVLESTAKDVASEKGNFNSDEVLMKDENKQDTRDSLADETPKEESTNSELQTFKSYQQSTEDKCLPKEPGINVTVGESPEDLEDTPDDNPQASSATEDTKEHQDATKGHPGNNQEDEISFTASDSEANREKTEVEGQGEHEERFNLGESAEEITQIFTDKDGSATEQQISDQDELTQETNENSAEEKRPDVTARERERNSDDLDKEASETVIVNNLVKEDAECWHSKEQTTTENIKILEITAEDATSEKETTRLHQENLLLKDDQETIVAYLGDTLKLPTDKKTLKDGEDLSFSENQEATVSLKDDIPEESPREIDDGFQASLSKEKEEDEMTTQFSAEVMNSGGTSQSLQSTTSSVDLLVASEDDTEVETTPQSLEDNCESLEKSRQEEPSVGTDTTEEEDISTVPNIEVKKAENEVNDCTPRDGEKIIPDDESSKFGKPEEAIITYTDKDAENEPEKDDNEDSEAVVQIEKEYAQDVASAENEGTFIQNLIEEPVDGNLENKIHDAITTEESSDQDKLTKGTSPKIDEEKNQDVISTKYEDEKEEAYEQLQASKPVKEETSNMNNDEQEKDLHATVPSVTQKFNESQEPSEQDGEGIVFAEDIYAEVVQQSHEGDSEDPATQIEKTSQPRSLVGDHQKPLENDQTAQENLNTSDVHSQAYQPNDQGEDRQATTHLFTKDISESQNPSEQDSEDAAAPGTAYAEVSPQSQEGDNEDHGTQTDQEANRQATTALGTNDINAYQVPSNRDGEDVVATEAAYAEVTSQRHGEDSQDPDTQMEESSKPYKLDDNHQTPLVSDQSSHETLDKVDVSSQAYQPKDQEEKQQARDTNEFQEPSELDGDDIVALEDAYEEAPLQSNEGNCEDRVIQIETPSQAHTSVDDYLTPLESDHSAQESLNTIDVNSHVYQPKDREEDQQGTVPPLTKNISESQEPSDRNGENVEATEAAYTEVTSQSYQENSQDYATPMESSSKTHAPVENHQTLLVSDQSAQETLDPMDVNSQAYQSKDQEEGQQATTSLVTKDNNESQEPSEQDGSDVVVLEPTYEEVTPQSNEGDSQDHAVQIETPSQPHTFIDDYQTPLDLDQSTQERLNTTYANLQAYQPKDHEEDEQVTGSSVAQDIKESQEPSERDGKYIVVPEATYAEVPQQSHERDSHDFPTQMEAPSQPQIMIDENQTPLESDHSTQETLNITDEPQELNELLITPDINEPQELNEQDGEEVVASEADYAKGLLQCSERDIDDPNTQREAPSQPHNLVDNYQNTSESDNNAQEILNTTDDNSQAIQPKDHEEPTQTTITIITPDINKYQKPNGPDGEGVVTLQSHERSNEDLATRIEAPSQPYTLVGGHENPLESNNTQESLNTEDVNSQVIKPIDHAEDRQAAVPRVTQDENKTLEPNEPDGEVVAASEATYAEVLPRSHEENNEAPATQMELPSQPHTPFDDHSSKVESDHRTEESLHTEDVHSRAFQPIHQKEEIESVTTSITRDIKESEEPSDRDDEDVVVLEATYTEVPPQSLEGDNEAPTTQTEIPAQPHTPIDDHSNKLELDHSTQEFLYAEDGPSRDFQPTNQKEEIEAITTYSAQDIKESKEPSERESEDVMVVEAAYEEVPPHSHVEDSEAPPIQMELPSQPHALVDDHSNKLELYYSTEEILHAEDVPSQAFQPIDQKEETESVTTSVTRDIKEAEEPNEQDDEDVVVLEAPYTEVRPQSLKGDNEALATHTEIPAQPHTPVNDHSNKLELDHSTQEFLYAEDGPSRDFQPTDHKEEIEAITTYSVQDIKESKEPSEPDGEVVAAFEATYAEVFPQSHEENNEAPATQMELPSQPHTPFDDHSNKVESDHRTEESLHAEDIHSRAFQPIDQTEKIEAVTTSITRDFTESEEPTERDDEDIMVLEATNTEVPPQSLEGDNEPPAIQTEIPAQPHTPVDDHSNKLELDHSTQEILYAEDVHSQDFQPTNQKEEIEAIITFSTQDIKESEEPSERDSEDVMAVEEVPLQSHEGDSEIPTIQMELSSQPHASVDDYSNKPIDQKEEIDTITTSFTRDIKESQEPSDQNSEDVMAVEAAYEEVPPQSDEGDSEVRVTQMKVPSQPLTPMNDHSNKLESDHSTEEILRAQDDHSRAFQPIDQKEEREVITTSVTQNIKEPEEPSERDSEDVMVVQAVDVEVPPQSHEGDSEAPTIQLEVSSQPRALVNDHLNKLETDHNTKEISHAEDAHSRAFQPMDHKEEREATTTSVTQYIKESEEPSEQDSEDDMAVEAANVEVPPLSHKGGSEAPATKIEVPSQPHAPIDDHQNKLKSDYSTDETLHAEDYHSQAFQPTNQLEEREATTTSVTQDTRESKEPSKRDGEDCVAPDAANVELSQQSYDGNNEDPAAQIGEPTQPHILLDDQQIAPESDQSTQENLNIEYAHSQAIHFIDQKEEHEAITHLVEQDIKESREPSERDGEDVVAPETAYVEATSTSHEGNSEDPPIHIEIPSQQHTAANDHQNKLELHQSTEDRLNTMDVHSQAVHPKDQENQQVKIPIITLEINKSKEANEHGVESVVPEVAYVEESPQSREEDTEDLAIQMEVPSQPHTRDDDHQHPLESDHIGQESLNTEDVNSEAFQPKELEEIHQTVIPLATEGINELQHPNRLDGEGIAAPQRHTRVNEDPTTQMEAPSQPHTLMDDSQNPLELEHGYQESLNIENVNSQAFKIKDQEEDQQAKIPSITQDINESEGANEQDGEGIMVPEFIDSEVTPQSHNGDFEGPATDPREEMSMDESTSMALTDKTKGEKTEQDIPGQYETQLTVPSEETPSPGKAAEEDKDEDGGYGSPEHQEFKNSTKGNTAEKSTSAQIENESAKTAAISMDESSELEKLNEKATLSDVDQEYSNVTEEILNLTNFTNEMADTPIQNTQDPAILQKGGPTCDSNLGQLTEEISPSRINKDEKFTDQEELTEEPSEHSIQENRQHIIATEHEKNSKDDLKEEADEPLEMNQVKEEAEHHHSQEQPREDHATNVPEALSGDVIPELENELLNEDKDNTISLPNDTAEKIEPETECPLQMSVDVKCLKKDTDRYSELPQAIDDGKTQDKETLGCNEDLVLLEGKGTTVESQDETLEENETKKQEPNEEQQTVLSEESLDQGKQPEETKLEHIDDEEERRDVIITETEKYSPDDLKEEACDPLDGHKLVKEETEHLQSDQPREDHVNNVPASEAQNAASETKASDINRAEIYPQSMLPCENQEAPIYLEAMLMENNDSIQKEPEHKDLAPRDQVTLERDLLGQALIEDHFSQEISNTTEENSQASLSSEQEENRLATMQLSETQETDKPPTLNDLVQPLEETYVEVDKQNLQQDGEDLANQVEAPSSGESTMRGSVDTDKGEDTNQNKNSSVVPTVEPMKEESEAKERGQYEEEQTVPNEEGVNLGETVEEATSTYTDKEKGADGHPTEEEGEEERAKDADISKNKDFTFDNFSKEMAHESTLMKEDTDVPEENKGDATQNFSISEQENLTEAREKSVEEKKQDAVSAEQAVSDLGKEAKEDINSFEGKENSSEHEGSEEITTVQIEKEDVKDATFTEHKEFNLVDDIINPSAQKETTHGPAIKEENESAMPTVSNLIEESTEGCLEKEKTEDLIVTQEESNPVILTEEMAQSQINKDKSKEIIFTKQESLDEEKLPGEASTAHSEEEKSQVDTVPEQEKICTDDLKERAEEPLEVNKLIEEETVHKIPTGHPTPDHDAKILEINEKKDEIISLVDKTLKEDATQSTEPKVVPRSDSPNSVITLEPEEVKDEGTINSEAEKAYMQPQENQGNEKDESQVIIMSIENQEVQSSIVSEATARNVLLTENPEGKGNISDVTIMKKVEESDVHKQDLEATAETSPIQTEMAEDNGLQSIKENQNFNEDEQAVEKGRTQVEGEGESREVKPIAEESIEVQEIDESQVDKNQQMGLVHLPVSQLLVNLILKEEGDKQYGFEEDTKGGFKGEENIKQQENSDPSLDKEGEMEEPKSQDLISAISEDTLILKDQDSKVVLPSREILINIAKNDGLTSEISHEIPKDEKKNETAEKSETEEEVNNIEFVNSNLEIKEKSDATMSSENINQVGNEASTILEDQRSDKQKTESISDGGKPSSADKVLPSSDKLIDIAKNKGLVFEISQEAPQGEKKNSTAEKGETACEVRDTDFEYSAPETKEKSDVITSAENLPQVYNETLILEDQGIDNQNSEKNSGGKSSSADIVLPSSETLIDIARDEGMVLEISHEVPQDEKKNATEEKSKTEGEVKDEEFANSTQEIIEKSDVITMSESPTQVYNEDSLILEDQDSNKQNTESNIDGGKTSKTDVLLPGPEILIDTAQDEGLVPEKKIETEESGETGHEIKDKDTIKPVPETKENSDALLLSKTVNNDIHQEKEVQKSDTISENHPRIEIQNKALMRDLLSETIETETSQSQGSEKALLRAQNPTPEPKSPVTEVNKVEGEASELKLEGKERTPVDDRKDRKTDELYSGERAAEEINETEPTDRDFHKQEMTMEGKDLPMSLEKSSKDATQDGSEEEKSDEGEERDEEEHKADKSAMDVSEKVETTEGDPKSPHKKSHNILSGVTSKVKHSIAKVKKAITGKPSHSKSPVAKEHT